MLPIEGTASGVLVILSMHSTLFSDHWQLTCPALALILALQGTCLCSFSLPGIYAFPPLYLQDDSSFSLGARQKGSSIGSS